MPKTGAATSLVVEKFFDTTTLLLLLGLVSLLVELPAPLAGVRRGLAAAVVLLPLVVVALAWRGTRAGPASRTAGTRGRWLGYPARTTRGDDRCEPEDHPPMARAGPDAGRLSGELARAGRGELSGPPCARDRRTGRCRVLCADRSASGHVRALDAGQDRRLPVPRRARARALRDRAGAGAHLRRAPARGGVRARDCAWRILVVDRFGCGAPSPLKRTPGTYRQHDFLASQRLRNGRFPRCVEAGDLRHSMLPRLPRRTGRDRRTESAVAWLAPRRLPTARAPGEDIAVGGYTYRSKNGP